MSTIRSIRDVGLADERRRLASSYNCRQIDRSNERSKQPQRDRIGAHILKYHDNRKSMRLLSMPGLRWSFEKQLAHAFKYDIWFTGLDWNWGTIELGACHMPGNRAIAIRSELKCGTMIGYSTDRAIWLWTHASSFLSMQRSDKVKGDRRRFANKYRRNTAIWLDMNNNMGTELEVCLQRIGGYCDMKTSTVPVAITFVVGHEKNQDNITGIGSGLERRMPAIIRNLDMNPFREFELIDQWMYEGETGCHMANVTGLLHLRNRIVS